jgi:hypothetical protein
MSNHYELEKSIWDDGDFEQMSWHDVTIHGIAFGPGEYELSLDIDYIFSWVHPAEGETYFRFWVAPCTLVFENVYDLHLEADPYGSTMLEVDHIRRNDPRAPKNAEFVGRGVEWQWTLECHNGEVSFRSVGFKQYVRSAPVLTQQQSLDLPLRGGYSFERGDGRHRTGCASQPVPEAEP